MSLCTQLQYPQGLVKNHMLVVNMTEVHVLMANAIMKERQKKNVGVKVGDGTEGRGGRKTGKEEGSPQAESQS